MLDLFYEIYQTLSNNKLRTALTGVAVAWGIFMLIVLLGMGQGVLNSFKAHVGDRASNALTIFGGRTTTPYKGYKEGRRIILKEDDFDPVADDNRNYVESVSGSIPGGGVLSTPHNYISTGFRGVMPEMQQQRGIKMLKGRFINQRDVDESRKVMVLSPENAEQLFPDSTKVIGGLVNCNGLSFTVIGVGKQDWGRDTYIPFSTAMMMRGNDGVVNEMTVNLKNVETIEDGEEVEKNVRKSLAAVHSFNPDDNSAIWIWNRFTQHLKQNQANNILQIVIWVIGIFTLLSGIVGVSNIMFVSVKERTHEIGIRRAIGAKPGNILTQVLTESVAITTLFGYMGIFLGILVTEGLNYAFRDSEFIQNPTVDISIAMQVTVVLIVTGALAGLFPALKALKVKPVEALRDE